MFRDLVELKSKLSNALIKRQRAIEEGGVDSFSGFTLSEIEEYIKLVCEEILAQEVESEKNYFWVKELKLTARSILDGKLERQLVSK